MTDADYVLLMFVVGIPGGLALCHLFEFIFRKLLEWWDDEE